ncbi:MAG: type II toxin-antitoxin system VapC family toxin [Burkholderiaceae bacterium]|nr:type II toxin-antitoxin system VapC family toxin [Burkholderiaceae bacterium]
MRLLLDTHLMLWWQAGDPSLSGEARSAVDAADAVFFSRASLWEIAIKASLGRLEVDARSFSQRVTDYGFEWLEIGNEHLIAVAELPIDVDHRDPFDRLLVAQSRVEPLVLLTADARLARYGETIRLV